MRLEARKYLRDIQVAAGRRARFGPSQVQVTPVDRRGQQVPNDVVRRVMGISEGSNYSDRAITEAQRSLFQLGVYRHVEVEPLPDSLQPPRDTIVVLAVRLTEDYTKHLDTEYGWATLDCGRIRAARGWAWRRLSTSFFSKREGIPPS